MAEPTDPHADLLRAIGRALGHPVAYGEAPRTDAGRRVLGGAVAAGSARVGWIEQRVDPPVDGVVPVEIDLRVACGGVLESVTPVETYNPFFGCRLEWVRWYDDVLVYLYREKHSRLLARLDTPSRQHVLVTLEHPACVVGDAVYARSKRWPELLVGRRLPSLESTAPIFAPYAHRGTALFETLTADGPSTLNSQATRSRLDDDDTALPAARIVSLPPPGSASRLRDDDRARMIDALRAALATAQTPADGVDILLESVAFPFLHDPQHPPRTSYPDAPPRDAPRARPWLPAYVCHVARAGGRTAESDAWIRWLAELATRPSRTDGWPHGESTLESWLATVHAHIGARASALSDACAKGVLPERAPGFQSALEPADVVGRLPGYVRAVEALHAAGCGPLPFRDDD